MSRIMGLDFGAKTVGVAVSDALSITAQGVEIIRRDSEKRLRRTLARIEELIKEYEVGSIVLGYPRNMDGSEGKRCEKTKEFQEMLLRRTSLPVTLWDERLTTVAAEKAMDEAGLDASQKKKHVDRIAAELILQGYLTSKNQ